MKLESFLCWCSPALRGVHGDFQPREGQKSWRASPAGPESSSPPAPAGPRGSWSSCLVAPRCRSLRATFPRLRGKLCSCFCLERTRGARLFLLLDVGFWGRAPRPCLGRSSGSGAVPSAFPLAHGGCLIYCSLLGNGEGGELAFLGVGPGCRSPLLPKKVPFPPLPLPWLPGQWETLAQRLGGPLVA